MSPDPADPASGSSGPVRVLSAFTWPWPLRRAAAAEAEWRRLKRANFAAFLPVGGAGGDRDRGAGAQGGIGGADWGAMRGQMGS